MHDHKKLKVWSLSHEFVLNLYKVTEAFPKGELFSVTSQMRRAGYSIPSNISEGAGRGSNKDFRKFLIIANGSAKELEYFLLLSKDLKYISENIYNEMNLKLIEITKMLNGLIKTMS